MAEIGLSELRLRLDEAMTYADWPLAKQIAAEGLKLAREKGLTGEIMYFQAEVEIIEGNFEEAIRFLDLAIQHNPKDGASYNDRALCMLELGKIDGAMPYFDQAILVEPDYASAYHNKGWLLNKLGHHAKALSLFEKALALEPGRAVTYENMADALINLNRPQEAIHAYQTALTLVKPVHHEIKKQIEEILRSLKGKV